MAVAAAVVPFCNRTRRSSRSSPHQHFGQLGDTGRDLPRLILGHKVRCRAPSRLRLEVDIRDGKIVGVANDVGDAAIFLDGPGGGKRRSGIVRGGTHLTGAMPRVSWFDAPDCW